MSMDPHCNRMEDGTIKGLRNSRWASLSMEHCHMKTGDCMSTRLGSRRGFDMSMEELLYKKTVNGMSMRFHHKREGGLSKEEQCYMKTGDGMRMMFRHKRRGGISKALSRKRIGEGMKKDSNSNKIRNNMNIKPNHIQTKD